MYEMIDNNSKDTVEKIENKGLVILCSIISIAIAVSLFFSVKYFFTLKLSSENIDTNNFLLFSDRNNQIIDNILQYNSVGYSIKYLVLLLFVAILGFFALVIDYASSGWRNKKIENFDSFGPKEEKSGDNCYFMADDEKTVIVFEENKSQIKKEKPYPSESFSSSILRLIPGIILGIYLGVSMIIFGKETINKDNFNFFFKGYDTFMVISQIVYIIAFLFLALLIFEAFSASGLLGSVIRIPLLIVSNYAMMLGLLSLIIIAFQMVVALLCIIFVLCFISVKLGPKVYVKY